MTTHVHREEIKHELETVKEKLKITLEALDALATLRPMSDAVRYRIAMQAVLECNVRSIEKSQQGQEARPR